MLDFSEWTQNNYQYVLDNADRYSILSLPRFQLNHNVHYASLALNICRNYHLQFAQDKFEYFLPRYYLYDISFCSKKWINSRWKKEWQTETVTNIARKIVTENENVVSNAPVLADALEEAGFNILKILLYLRTSENITKGNIVIRKLWRHYDESIPKPNWKTIQQSQRTRRTVV